MFSSSDDFEQSPAKSDLDATAASARRCYELAMQKILVDLLSSGSDIDDINFEHHAHVTKIHVDGTPVAEITYGKFSDTKFAIEMRMLNAA